MKTLNAPKWVMTISLLSVAMFCNGSFAQDTLNPFSIKSEKSHDLILLNHGLASLEERLQMIDRAEKSIDVEYFIYRTDKSAKLFTQALVKKARQGVKVRMLLDYFMVKSDLSPFYTHELEKEGIEIKYFNITTAVNLFSGQYRNHRKILLIDGKEIITGGRNIGDEYFDLSKDYNFLDRELHIEGEVVKSIETTFNETFSAEKSVHVSRAKMPEVDDAKYNRGDAGRDDNGFNYDLKKWNDKVVAAKKFINDALDSATEASIRSKGEVELKKEYHGTCDQLSFHSEYPSIGTKNRKESRVIKHFIFDKIQNAQKSIMIDSPYFIVNNELAKAMNSAFDKKMDVKLLTNSLNSTDAIYVYAAFDSIANEWLKKGLDSYIFKGQRPRSYEVVENLSGEARFGVHAKTFVFDNKDTVIGTYNVDPRSANYNAEMIIACENNPELAAQVQNDINSRMAESIHLDSAKAIKDAEFYQTSFGKKLLYYIVKIPSNIFGYLL
ncbi:MAG: phosphatidylserine/phosphatidylglycerophosphate/cardiolipin synthase family protein [Bacteriovorax sp.]|nr:phosphatidylserine/phosphatidylglycerophosphate/cardiolipin synthase family protein [Bacteriovorax sp.]